MSYLVDIEISWPEVHKLGEVIEHRHGGNELLRTQLNRIRPVRFLFLFHFLLLGFASIICFLRLLSRTGGLLALAGLLVAGCASNVNTVERAQPEAKPHYVSDKRVITDNTLAGTIGVVAITQTTVSGNLLKLQATVENLKNSTRTLNYKFEWVDRDGMTLSSPTDTWKSIRLMGRETRTITAVATSPSAVDFTLKLRE